MLSILRVLLFGIIASATISLTQLAIITMDAREPALAELVFWIGSQIGFGALTLILLLPVARRRAR